MKTLKAKTNFSSGLTILFLNLVFSHSVFAQITVEEYFKTGTYFVMESKIGLDAPKSTITLKKIVLNSIPNISADSACERSAMIQQNFRLPFDNAHFVYRVTSAKFDNKSDSVLINFVGALVDTAELGAELYKKALSFNDDTLEFAPTTVNIEYIKGTTAIGGKILIKLNGNKRQPH